MGALLRHVGQDVVFAVRIGRRSQRGYKDAGAKRGFLRPSAERNVGREAAGGKGNSVRCCVSLLITGISHHCGIFFRSIIVTPIKEKIYRAANKTRARDKLKKRLNEGKVREGNLTVGGSQATQAPELSETKTSSSLIPRTHERTNAATAKCCSPSGTEWAAVAQLTVLPTYASEAAGRKFLQRPRFLLFQFSFDLNSCDRVQGQEARAFEKNLRQS